MANDVGKTCTGEIEERAAPNAAVDAAPVGADEDDKMIVESDEEEKKGGRRRHSRRHRKTLRAVPKGVHVKAKTLKKLLKSKGLKVSGKKATLRARARKAHLIRGGASGVLSSSPATV
jgi:hypothetical protein